LNTTARKELKKLIVLTSYLDLGSYLVISLDLAEEIGKFKIEALIKQKEEVDEEKIVEEK
jgi:hypothetical protein